RVEPWRARTPRPRARAHCGAPRGRRRGPRAASRGRSAAVLHRRRRRPASQPRRGMSRKKFVLALHSVGRIRGVVVGVAVLLCAFQFLLTQVAAYLTRQSAFSALFALMPDFVRTVAGPSALAFMSFTGVVSLGYFHPIVIATLAGLMIT